MGTHWVTYFYTSVVQCGHWYAVAIYLPSNYCTFRTPIFFNTRFQLRHLILGGLTLLGIYFLVPTFTLATTHGAALALGIFRRCVMRFETHHKKSITKNQWESIDVDASDYYCPVLLPLFYRLKKLKAALIFGKHCSSWPYLQQ